MFAIILMNLIRPFMSEQIIRQRTEERSIFAVMTQLARQHGAINLSQGFPDFDPPSELMTLVFLAMQQGKNQYAPMPGVEELLHALARKYRLLYGADLRAQDEITITAGATQALFTAILAVVERGDEVIVFEPAYDSYIPAIRRAGGTPVPYAMTPPDYRIDWDAVEKHISPRTKLMILNTPHNPTGTILTDEDIAALRHIAQRYDIVFLWDEVYEHIIFDGKVHHSALRYPELFAKSLVVYSFGKTYHNTGWKTGYVIAPPALTAQYRYVHQYNVFSVHTPVQHAYAQYLQHSKWYESLPDFYQKKRDLFAQLLEQTPLKIIPCHGTYFQLVDYSDITSMSDIEFAHLLTTQYGVACIPVSVFYSDRRDYKVVRFCFAKREETLRRAAEKLQKIPSK